MKTQNFIFVVLAIIGLNSAVIAQQKHALLIGGNYLPGDEIPVEHRWNNGQDMDLVKGYAEFWHDTYLMWELLYDHKYGYSNDNIKVLFAGGEDYSITFDPYDDHYRSASDFPNIPFITDDIATRTNVLSALDELANVEPEDYVFIWIMSNGGNTEPAENVWSYVYLWGYDPGNPNAGRLYDYELKAKLDQIPAHKKVVVVQAPNSGKFATTLADDNTIVYTSSGVEEPASRANDTPYDENEEWDGETYYHGEFGYHFYSPLNGKDPGGNTQYGDDPFSGANIENDDVISFWEAFEWEDDYNSATETPSFWAPQDLARHTSVQYSTIIFEDFYSSPAYPYIGIIGITGYDNGYIPAQTTIFIGEVEFKDAILYFLDDTRFKNESGSLILGKGVKLYGDDGASGLIIESDFEFDEYLLFSGWEGSYWGGLFIYEEPVALEKATFIDCHASLYLWNSLSVNECQFTRSGIIGKYIFPHLYVGMNSNFINSFGHFDTFKSCDAVIEDCHFTGPNIHYSNQFGLQLRNFIFYTIENNVISGYNYGVDIYNCGVLPLTCDITNNSVNNNSICGIYVSRSSAKIFDNPGIYENGRGIVSTASSNVEIYGNEYAKHISETQRIHDNDFNQIWADKNSFPVYLRWNAIWKDYNEDCLLKWEYADTDPPQHDISNNFWGNPEFFDAPEDLCPVNYFNWEPVWELEWGDPTDGEDKLIYLSAQTKAEQGDFIGAKTDYQQLVTDYSYSRFAEAALKELLPLEEFVSNDYVSLQNYYLSTPDILNNPRWPDWVITSRTGAM